jgi:DNA repair exonuclease SbcCD ATPase subunit
MSNWNTVLTEATAALSQRRKAKQRLVHSTSKLRQARGRISNLTESRTLFQKFATQLQSRVEGAVGTAVNNCLKRVFGKDFHFRLRFESKRGKTEASLFFQSKGAREDALESRGGGVVDVTAFALRLATLRLAGQLQPGSTLVLDEPFRFVSPTYRDALGRMLETAAVEFGVQFILVTHDDLPTVSGRVFTLRPGRRGAFLEGKVQAKEAKDKGEKKV